MIQFVQTWSNFLYFVWKRSSKNVKNYEMIKISLIHNPKLVSALVKNVVLSKLPYNLSFWYFRKFPICFFTCTFNNLWENPHVNVVVLFDATNSKAVWCTNTHKRKQESHIFPELFFKCILIEPYLLSYHVHWYEVFVEIF